MSPSWSSSSFRFVLIAAILAVLAGSAERAGVQASGDPLDDPLRSPFEPAEDGAPEFAAGVGYAHISVGDSDSPLDSEDGLRFEFGLSYSPIPNLPQLCLGGAFGTAIAIDSGETAVVSSGGLFVASNGDVSLFTFEPEARLSWRQTFGDSGFFIEPGIAGGGFIAYFDFDVDDDDDFFDDGDDDFDDWDATWSARAFVNVGIQHEAGAGGIQASYLRGGDLDLGSGTDGDVEEFYVGIFGTLRF